MCNDSHAYVGTSEPELASSLGPTFLPHQEKSKLAKCAELANRESCLHEELQAGFRLEVREGPLRPGFGRLNKGRFEVARQAPPPSGHACPSSPCRWEPRSGHTSFHSAPNDVLLLRGGVRVSGRAVVLQVCSGLSPRFYLRPHPSNIVYIGYIRHHDLRRREKTCCVT